MNRISRLKSFLSKSIKNKLISLLILFTTLPLLFFAIYTYTNLRENKLKEFTYSAEENLNKCIDLINKDLFNYVMKSAFVASNRNIIRNVQRNYGDDLLEKVLFYNEVNVFMDNILLLDRSWKNFFVVYISNESLYENRYFEFLDNSSNKEFIINNVDNLKSTDVVWMPDISIAEDGEKYIYLYRNLLPDLYTSAILETRIFFSEILFYINDLDLPKGSLVIYRNAGGQDVYVNASHSQSKTININEINYENYIVFNNTFINSHSLAIAISRKEINKDVINSYKYVLIVIIIAIFCIGLASNITLKRVTGNLNEFIESIKDDNSSLKNIDNISINGNDEVSIVKKRFKGLVQTINALHIDNIEYQNTTNSLEIELLQSKINPHLLYNSLSVLKWAALRKKDQNMVEFIDSLTKYYRIVLNKGNNILKIREEFNMINEYVKINNFSRAVDIILTIDADEKVMDCYTLKHIVQPVVENAIIHGLNGKEGEELICVKAFQDKQCIILVIEDNGHGMSQETIEKIMDFEYTSEFGGFGIKNLISRIKTYYGEEYGIEIQSEIGKFTKIKIRVPIMKKEHL